MDIANFFAPPDILKAHRILCIQPHPDDNDIGMGGTIAALAQNGCDVHSLTVTNGDLGLLTPTLTHEQLATLRKQEAITAGKLIGVSAFHFFDEPDGSLNDIPALAGKIAELIRTIQPDVVFCPDPWALYEAHQDHVITGRAAAQAVISCSLVAYPRGTVTKPWQPMAMGLYFTQTPNTVIDISKTFEVKFEAMAAHQTQMNDELLAMYRVYFTMQGQKLANAKGFTLGEGLRVLSPMHLHCFVEAPLI